MASYIPADKPTMYFIGVTTAKSSINKIFPVWADALGLGDCQLRGIDFKLHDEPARYREAVEFIKHDPHSLGALVTTHKIDLYTACKDIFDEVEPFSAAMGEVSSIFKRGGRLHGRAVDPYSSGSALEAFLPAGYWEGKPAEALILGAGGSGVALVWHLVQAKHGKNLPAKIHVANRSEPRLRHLEQVYKTWNTIVPLETHVVPKPTDADAIMEALPPGSLVVNATGLGKDAPGSPLSESGRFPERGYAWEYNYRGDLLFLDYAKSQAKSRDLFVEDGWTYFVHGWTRVISDVFDANIPTSGPEFDRLSQLASATR